MAFRYDLPSFAVERKLNPEFINWGPEQAEKMADDNGESRDTDKYDAPVGERPAVFLAGTIEMNKSPDWQTAMTKQLQDLPIAVLNPRRKNFENWEDQTKANQALMRQIEWEWKCLKQCDVIAMYLHSGTVSPISLLELGYFSKSGKVLVCCPAGFARQANVQYVCKEENVTLYEDVEEFLKATRERLLEKLETKKPA